MLLSFFNLKKSILYWTHSMMKPCINIYLFIIMKALILTSTKGLYLSNRALCGNVMLLNIFKCISPLIILIVSTPTFFIWFQGRKKNKRMNRPPQPLLQAMAMAGTRMKYSDWANIWIIFTSESIQYLLLLTLSLIILNSANLGQDVREIGNQLIIWKYPKL